MPHLTLEYSENLDAAIDMTALCRVIHQAAIETEVFPLAGIRVRAISCAHYSIADQHPDNGFIDISVRLRKGRAEDVKKAATLHIFEAAKTYLADYIAVHPIALSLEMRDIDPDLSPKLNTISDHMKGRS